jgi:hypothetical protein
MNILGLVEVEVEVPSLSVIKCKECGIWEYDATVADKEIMEALQKLEEPVF